VAAVAFKMAKEDVRSFIFLSNYLLLSCKNLEKKGVALSEIQKRLLEIIAILGRKYPPAPEIWAEEEHFKIHSSYIKKDLIPKI
jgi:hypothetical protein